MDSRRKASLPKYAEGEARGSRNRSSVNKQTVGQEKGVRYGPAHDNSLMLTAEGKVRGHTLDTSYFYFPSIWVSIQRALARLLQRYNASVLTSENRPVQGRIVCSTMRGATSRTNLVENVASSWAFSWLSEKHGLCIMVTCGKLSRTRDLSSEEREEALTMT